MTDLSIWDDFVKKGKLKELLFGKVIEQYGLVEPAEVFEDINEHWDIKLSLNDNSNYCPLKIKDNIIRFDVKVIKKIKRSDETVNENLHYDEAERDAGRMA